MESNKFIANTLDCCIEDIGLTKNFLVMINDYLGRLIEGDIGEEDLSCFICYYPDFDKAIEQLSKSKELLMQIKNKYYYLEK